MRYPWPRRVDRSARARRITGLAINEAWKFPAVGKARCLRLPPLSKEVKSMNLLINALMKLGLLKEDLDYHLLRASMIVLFLFFGYQKWFQYEAEVLIPYISNGPLISWMYPVFGVRGAARFLGLSEWSFAALLYLGFWHKRLGILGALGSCAAFIGTITIIPFMPGGWAASAGGFPAMAGNVPFLMKDVVLFAVSVYLLKQDVARASLPATRSPLILEGTGLKVTQ